MNFRRGLFRLWLLFAVLFAVAVGVKSYHTIRDEFREAALPRDRFDMLAAKFGGELLLPVDCLETRGDSTTYSIDRGSCWYTIGRFRELYPEYRDIDDSKLSDRLYAKAGIPLTYPRPWRTTFERIGIAIGGPLAVLAFGWCLGWVLAGFRQTDTNFRNALPRVFELKDMLDDPSHPDAYFHNFEQSLADNRNKREAFLKLERQLAVLDGDAWRDLKQRAAVHLQNRTAGRGWQDLFDAFSEATGYAFLRSIGVTNIRFISRTKGKTPDLEGQLAGQVVLCEVKTINVSQDEAERRQQISQGAVVGGHVSPRVDDGFLRKLMSNLERAVKQLDAHDPQHKARRFVLTVVHFDDWVGDYQREYFEQIDAHLSANPVAGADLVFCPGSNLFGRTFAMKSATVFDPESMA